MKNLLRKKFLKKSFLIFSVCFFIFWDFENSLYVTMETGTYRLESDFSIPYIIPAKVSVVPSDLSSLSDPVARTIDPSYLQVEAMVRKAIELQGGLTGIVSQGDTVMLKVNLVGANSPSGQGENTDTRVVKALIKILDEFASGDIVVIVAEGSARSNDDPNVTGSVWHNSGYIDLLYDSYLAGIDFKLLNINQGINDLVEIDLGSEGTGAPHQYKYKIHKQVVNADVYISVPVLKIHDTGITCALKNQIGIAPGCYYGYNKMSGTSYHNGLFHDDAQRRWTTEEIVDLSHIANIDFIIVDAVMCLESYKSYKGDNQVRMNTVLAGKDPVAVDHVCARLFCINPDDVAHITLAEKVGLGTNDRAKITVVGDEIDNIKKNVKKNSTINGLFGQSNRTWLLSQTYAGTNLTTEYITGESSFQPIEGQDAWSYPVYFFDDRIDLLSYYKNPTNVTTYAFTSFYAPKTQSAELWIGYDEAIRVYINGVNVFENTSLVSYSDSELEKTKQSITIQKGLNTMMVKTVQTYADFSFVLNICEPDNSGNRVDGLFFFIQSIQDYPPDSMLLSDKNINENIPLNSLVSRILVVDRNPEDIYKYTLVTGSGDNNNSWFTLKGDSLMCNHSVNYEENDTLSICLLAEDINNDTNRITQAIKISVHNVNEPPVSLAIDNTGINENNPVLYGVACLSTIDEDQEDDHFYSLVAGEGSDYNNLFVIKKDSLLAHGVFNFEEKQSYSIRVRVTDAGGLYLEDTFRILIHDIAEVPEDIILSGNCINEGLPAWTFIGLFSSVDEDGNPNIFTFANGEGSDDNDLFIIKNDSLFSDFVADNSTKPVYSIRVRSTDQTGLYMETIFQITISELFTEGCFLSETDNPILCYPNPFNNILYIKAKKNKNINSYQLFDMQGKLLYSEGNIFKNELIISIYDLPSATYLMVCNIGGIIYKSTLIRKEKH